MSFGRFLKRAWRFIWDDNSVWSWLVNVVVAFVLIKFVVYPGLGLLLGTTHPIVAVVSGSMVHDEPFGAWWESNGAYYEQLGIDKEEFARFPMRDGFNVGDIIVLRGAGDARLGDIIVFRSSRPDPIIHRVIEARAGSYTTKGDHNPEPIRDSTMNEHDVNASSVIGKSFIRIPLLGYIKIGAVQLFGWFAR